MVFAYWELVANFLLGVVWPFLFGFLAIRYGKQTLEVIKYIAENFRSGRFGPFEIIMTEEMAEAREAAAEAGIESRPASGVERRQIDQSTETSLEHPVATIMLKYAEVREALERAALARGLLPAQPTLESPPPERLERMLVENSAISGAVVITLSSLRSMRNRVAHASPERFGTISVGLARQYEELADGVIDVLREVAREAN